MRVLFKWLLRLFLIAIIGLPLLLAAALYLAVEDRPLISRAAEIKPENIERARRIVERNDPRKMRPGVLRTIAITGPDLDLAVNYLANRYARGSAAVVLQQGPIEPGWTELFNGKDFTGWKVSGNQATFKIQDGALVANGPVAHAFYDVTP